MKRAIPIEVGSVFGRLTVTEVVSVGQVRVRCSCGVRRTVWVSQLRRRFGSCGRCRVGIYWPTEKAWAL